jgi:transformation/transcription domain-associated protein
VQIYQNFRTTVSYFFDESSAADVQLAAAHHNLGYMGQMRSPAGGPMSGQLNPSTRSFKVVTECPLIVMFLFQLYPRYVPQNIPVLLPLMVSAIGITGPTEVPPTLKNVYAELKGAQVKVLLLLLLFLTNFDTFHILSILDLLCSIILFALMDIKVSILFMLISHVLCLQTVSFLTYLLRSFADCIRPHEDSISKSIVSLLVSCPDSVSIRKVRPAFGGGFRIGYNCSLVWMLLEN